MKYTLLEVVQHVLSSMDSDDVDSIDETSEAEQIVLIAEEIFYDIINSDEWPHIESIDTLVALSDTDFPNVMQLPTTYRVINSIRYNVAEAGEDDDYRIIHYKTPFEFLEMVLRRNSTDSNVEIVADKNNAQVKLNIFNDQQPEWYTSFDDEYIVFDSYDSSEDTTLQSSKSLIVGEKLPTFTQDGSVTPDLPIHMFPWYLAEVKRAAHLYLKQQDSVNDQRKALEHKSRLRRTKSRLYTGEFDERARKDFGRVPARRQHYPKLGRR